VNIIRSKPKNCTTCRHKDEEALDDICNPCMLTRLKEGTYPSYEPKHYPKPELADKNIAFVHPGITVVDDDYIKAIHQSPERRAFLGEEEEG
jgi:hypothetical protein